MADSSEDDPPLESKSLKTQFSLYSQYLLNGFRRLLPISHTSADSSKAAILNIYGSPKRRRRKTFLPLPLPSAASVASSEDSSAIQSEAFKIFEVLEDILEHLLRNLHCIQKNLEFWQSKAESSNGQKAYFMLCERGPSAFLGGTVQLMYDFLGEGSSIQKVYLSANSHISQRISVFSSLRYFLATFLAKIYTEVGALGKDFVKNPSNSLPLILFIINDLFMDLEASVNYLHTNNQAFSQVNGSIADPLLFAKLPELKDEGTQLTGLDISDSISLIYENLHKLDSYLSVLVSKHCKPRKLTLYWVHCSCGALGVSLFSLWLLRHSKFMGSSDLENWIRDAKDSTKSFWNDHVEQPIVSIRDELFETFRKRQKGVMEREEVQLTADSLHRMLLAFSEQASGRKFAESTPDQEMLEILMTRYEKELTHPIQGLVGGELVRGLLIQVQKLKLDIEEAMLELDQILRANEINFAILAALPAFAITSLLVMLVRAWLKQDRRAEGRGRVARIQRRLLLREIERAIMQCKVYGDQGLENDAQCMYGVALCLLDSLHGVVERHASATGEWICLRKDIIDLAKPGLPIDLKLHVAARMERMYDCLLPASNRK